MNIPYALNLSTITQPVSLKEPCRITSIVISLFFLIGGIVAAGVSFSYLGYSSLSFSFAGLTLGAASILASGIRKKETQSVHEEKAKIGSDEKNGHDESPKLSSAQSELVIQMIQLNEKNRVQFPYKIFLGGDLYNIGSEEEELGMLKDLHEKIDNKHSVKKVDSSFKEYLPNFESIETATTVQKRVFSLLSQLFEVVQWSSTYGHRFLYLTPKLKMHSKKGEKWTFTYMNGVVEEFSFIYSKSPEENGKIEYHKGPNFKPPSCFCGRRVYPDGRIEEGDFSVDFRTLVQRPNLA